MPLGYFNNNGAGTARDRLRRRAAALPEIKAQPEIERQQRNQMLDLLDAARTVERMQGQQETSARDRLRARAAEIEQRKKQESYARERVIEPTAETETVGGGEEETARERARRIDPRRGALQQKSGTGFSAGKLLAGMAEKGTTSAARGMSETLSWLEKALFAVPEALTGLDDLQEQHGVFYKWNEGIKREQQAAEKKYAENIEKGGKAAELLDRYGAATVAAIPQAVSAFMSGGMSLGGQGLEALSTAAQASPTILNSVRQIAMSYAKNPQYWTSFLQTAGNSYAQAKEDGASEMQASLYALTNGLGNAAIEVGGGLETLPGELKEGPMTFKRWLKAAHEEGGEEVWQGIVERGLQNLAYGKKNPIASLTDENAVLNPRTSAQEYAGGAVVGGVLGGGQALAASGVNSTAQKAKLERAYQETGAAIKQQGMLNDLVQMGLGMGDETSKSAQIIQDKIARGESVSDREVGVLLRQATDEARRIQQTDKAPETSAENEKNRPAAQEPQTAQTETAQQAKPFDAQQFPNLGRYFQGETAQAQNRQDNRTDFQREVARQMGMEPETDFVWSARVLNVDRETTERVQRLSEAIGREVVFYQGDAGENGYFDRKSGKIYVNVNSGNAVSQIVGHELTHTLEGAADYARIKSMILNRIGGQEDLAQALTRKQESYARHGVTLDRESAERELVAEFVEKRLLTDEAAIREIVAYEPSFGERILNVIDALLAKLGNKNAEERAFLRRTRELYSRALSETRGNYEAGRVNEQVNRGREDLAARLEAGELTEEEYNEAMDALEEDESLNDVSMLREYSISDEEAQQLLQGFGIEKVNDYVHVQNQVFDTLKNEGILGPDGRRIVTNNATGRNVEISKRGIFETFGRGNRYETLPRKIKELKLAAARMLPEIIENGKIVALDQANEHNQNSNLTYSYIKADVQIGGETYPVYIDIRQSPQRNLFWVHRIYTEQDQRRVTDLAEAKKSRPEPLVSGDTVPDSGQDVKEIKQKNVRGLSLPTLEKTDTRTPFQREIARQLGMEDGGKKAFSIEDSAQETAENVRDTLPQKARDYLKRTENAMLRRISGALDVQSWARRDYLQGMVREMSDEYLQSGSVSQETVDRLFETAWEQGRIVDSEMYDTYKEVRNRMRTTAVTISETDKADFTDWGDWRRSATGRLKIVNSGGLPVDVAYEQLQDMAPDMFPADITRPADQLRRMLEVSQSTDRVEKTLDEQNGKDFKAWAKNDFAEAVNQTLTELRTVRRYDADKKAEKPQKKILTVAEAKETWKQVKQLRRGVDRAVSRNLLTESDELLVGRLLRGEITPESLPGDSNAKGIREVYEAKREYEQYAEQLREFKRSIRAARRESADAMLREAGHTKDKIAGLLLSRETMERNIEDVFRDKAGAKRITEAYIEPVHKAEANKTRWLNEMRDRVRKMNLSRKIEQGNEVSEAHAVQLLGEATDNIEMLQKSRGRLRERDGKTLSDWQGIVENLKEQNPNLDFAKIEQAVQNFRDIYDELFERMNEVRVRNGYEPINYRHGYFPHFQPGSSDGILTQFGKAMGITTEITALPTTINGLTHTFKPGIAWFGNAQERLGFNTAYDAVEGFDKYVQGAGDVIFHTDNIQNLRALSQQIRYRTSDEGIRKQVDEVLQDKRLTEDEKQTKIDAIYEHGKFELGNFVNELEEYTNLLANKKSKYDRNMEAMIGRRAYTIMKNWESRVGANMIAGNIGSALTNFIPLTQANAQLESGQILKGMWQTLQAYKNKDGFAERSAFLTSRRGTDPLVKNWQQKASGVLGTPMELIDRFASDSIVRARYNQNLRHNMSEQAAMDDADAFARRVMADRSKGSMPTLFQSSNPIVKLFTQFQLEVNNQFSEVFKDLPKVARERGMAVLVGTLLKYFLGAYLFNDVYEYFVGRRCALDPIGILNETAGDLTGYELPNMIEAITGEDRSLKTEKTGTYEALGNLAKNAVDELPMVGGILGGGRIPISSSLPDVENLAKAAVNDKWSGKKRLSTAGKELSKPLIYAALPFGGNQLQKAWKGTKAIIEGGSYSMDSNGDKVLQYPVFNNSKAETAGNIARALFFGKSSLKPAREWVNNGFNSLSAKQTAIYEDLTAAGVKSREAYGLIDELRSAKAGDEQSKAERQREILQSSNINDKGKAIVFYGLLASDKEREGMDAMTDAGMDSGRAGEVVMTLKDAGGTADKLSTLAGMKLNKEQTKVAAGYVMGTDLETDGGNPTQYAKLLRAMDAGLDPSQAMRLRADGMDLGKVLEYKDAGLDIKTAVSVAEGIGGLKPQEGKKEVSDVQKWRAALDAVSGAEKQMQALSVVMPEDQYKKIEIAHRFGVQPESYVKLKEIMPEYDANQNGSYSQDEVKAAIDAMGGAVRGLSLPTLGGNAGLPSNHSAVLWQLMTTSKSAKNNPYSRSIGQQVLDAKELGNARGGGLSLPSLGG